MAVFVVMEPADVGDAAEKAVFVRDGFHGLALVLPVVWLLAHRLWIEALAAFGLMAAAGILAAQLGGHPLLGSGLSLLINLYFGLEAPALWLANLKRGGHVFWGTVEAHTLAEAELRYAAEVTAAPAACEGGGSAENGGEAVTRLRLPGLPPRGALGLVSYPWSR